MKESNKEDRRVKYTKMVLKEAMLDLLRKKTLDKITITEVCKKADINRNTFYSHYDNTHDLIVEIENEIFEKLLITLSGERDIEKVFQKACQFLKDNKKISEIIFLNRDEMKVFNKFLNHYKELETPATLMTASGQDIEIIQQFYKFSEGGSLAVLEDWVLGGFKEPADQVAKSISYMANAILQSIHSFKTSV
ncbi:TetR/AcrR family transcriptional regulator C-terminal domain-containing protein [Paracrocinitomix mangrovi]|uniref:TetR/AcrR family transcriptional regulator n=1 Tax=Paracrocinitomix mangrovi TaxID=2862509 RepID=UPI001C8E9B20|nr:TetR-like C-terminal domain-containing protein [Paracrocinitomix mangrovi]UKN00265.1 TetR/AcrR family transcriptional regulator C-terminal domain-containing protein [Paracrocinitomix mangrovi]